MAIPPIPHRVPISDRQQGFIPQVWSDFFLKLVRYVEDSGVPEWNASTTYAEDYIVRSGGEMYRSKVDDNVGNPVSDSSKWESLSSDLSSRVFRTGMIQEWLFSSIPSGWLALNGQTIGSAASGADRANADTEALFTLFWNDYDNTALPILDSSGSPTTRGASAAADFAANKRLPIFNAEGLVARGTGTQAINGRNKQGPTLGQVQEDAIQNMTGVFRIGTNRGPLNLHIGGAAATGVFKTGTTNRTLAPSTTEVSSARDLEFDASQQVRTTSGSDSETRVASFGVRWIIKL